MSQIIKIKSGTSGQPSSLARGELAINVSNGAFYFGDAQSATTANWFFSATSANTVSATTITAAGDYLSGTTNLLDIFASSAITNQDVYWSANTNGSISNSGLTNINVGVGTITPNEELTVVGSISASTSILSPIISGVTLSASTNIDTPTVSSTTVSAETLFTTDIKTFSGSYLRVAHGLSDSFTNTILFQPSQTYFQEDIKMADNKPVLFGVGGDMTIYHDGTDNHITAAQTLNLLTGNSGIAINLGHTTSEVNAKDNFNVIGNQTVSGSSSVYSDFTVDNDGSQTLHANSSTNKVGVGARAATHQLTVSGTSQGTGSTWTNTGNIWTTLTLVNGSTFIQYTPADLAIPSDMNIAGQTIRVKVGSTYYYGNITGTGFAGGRGYFGLTWAGSNTTLCEEEESCDNLIAYGGPGDPSLNPNHSFAVYDGTNMAMQVTGTSIMSGSTDLLDIFDSGITSPKVYWSANTNGSISNSGLTNINVGVGTITPNEELTVAGSISASTSILSPIISGVTLSASTNIDAPIVSATTITATTSVSLPDNGKLKLGNAGDLEIYHNGSNSYIDDTGTGTLFYRSGTQTFQNAAGSKTMAVFNAANSVDLYYNNNQKFETTNVGIKVTGEAYATTQLLSPIVSGVTVSASTNIEAPTISADTITAGNGEIGNGLISAGTVSGSYQYVGFFSSIAGSYTTTNDWIVPSAGGGISNHTWNQNTNYLGSNNTVGTSKFTPINGMIHVGMPAPFDGFLEGFFCVCRNNGGASNPRNAGLFVSTVNYGDSSFEDFTLRAYAAGDDDGGSSNSKPYKIDGMLATGYPVSKGDVVLPAMYSPDANSVAAQCTWTVVFKT